MADVVDLGNLTQFRPDVEALARTQIAAARDRLDMDFKDLQRHSVGCSVGHQTPTWLSHGRAALFRRET
jgi:hypothetical protein